MFGKTEPYPASSAQVSPADTDRQRETQKRQGFSRYLEKKKAPGLRCLLPYFHWLEDIHYTREACPTLASDELPDTQPVVNIRVPKRGKCK